MAETIIKVEDLSKQYRLGQIGTGSLSHDINRWWHQIRGKDDPYLKIGETNDRTQKGNSDYVWALKDINFENTFCKRQKRRLHSNRHHRATLAPEKKQLKAMYT